MARRETTVELTIETDDGESKEVQVKVFEVRPKDVFTAYDAAKEKGVQVFIEDEYYLKRCTTLTIPELQLLYPNDIEKLITAFKKVNKSFLAPWPTIKKMIAKVGLVEWLGGIIENSEIKEQIGKTLAESLRDFAPDLQNEDTPESGTTDGNIS